MARLGTRPQSEAPRAIGLAHAVELAATTASVVASAHSIRALIIKGPVLYQQGLREARVSADADIWVDAAGFDDVVARLGRAGWIERPRWRISDTMTTHSISLMHPEWPCDIDVHRHFPGFLAPPAAVFEELWARHVDMDFAGIACAVPDRASSAVILALHSLRSSPEQVRHVEEYESLVSRLGAEDDPEFLRQISEVAAATGAAGTLEPFLLAIGAEVPDFDRRSPGLTSWIAHVNARNDVTAVFAERWADTPWRGRPRVLALALWPSNAELRLAQPERTMSTLDLAGARFARLGRAVVSVPRAVTARRRARRGEWDSPYVKGNP